MMGITGEIDGCLTKIANNFTNDHDICVQIGDEAATEVAFKAGSKCALLKSLELFEHKCSPVQTRVVSNKKRKGWRTLTEKEILQQIDNIESNNVDTSSKIINLTLMNWNIDCPVTERMEFYQDIMDIIERILPDFCCFQNVQHEFRASLRQNKKIGHHYYLSNSNLDYMDFTSHTHHGLVTISRWPCEFMEYPFIDTHVGRYLLACQTVVNGIPIVVAHSHLDNKKNKRQEKIKKAGNILSVHENVIWLGEFGDMSNDIRDTLRSYMDMDEIGEGDHVTDGDHVTEGDHVTDNKILVRSEKIKPGHFFNLNNGMPRKELANHRDGVVGILNFAGFQ